MADPVMIFGTHTTATGIRPLRAAYSRPETKPAPDRIRAGQRPYPQVVAVLGSNQRRLSRRFYIPEGAGRGQGVVRPFLFRFRIGLRARRKQGRVKGGPPSGQTTVTLALPFRRRLVRAGNVLGCGGGAPRVQVVSGGRLSAAFIPSGVPAAGCRGGMGRVRVRAAGSIRQAAGPPGAGASKTVDHALLASGPAHAACRRAAARDLTWPSRMA